MNRQGNLKSHILAALAVLALLCPASAKIIYVDDDAAGANDGSSWENACTYLQDALAAAVGGDEIRVAQGTYRPDQGQAVTGGDKEATFQLVNGVVVRGGYAGYGEPDPDAWDSEFYETILSGDLNADDVGVANPRALPFEATRQENSYHVVTGSGTDETTVLDGFTIVGGNAFGFFAMYDHRIFGGGFYNHSGSPTVMRCTFRNNSAGHAGGGMANRQGSNPAVSRCKFTANATTNLTYIADEDESYGGGAANSHGSSPTFTDCVFADNSARFGGGMAICWDSSPTLERCSFISNSVWRYGGGILCFWDSNPILNQCEFLGNDAGWAAGGMGNMVRCQARLTCCVFAGNTAPPGGAGFDNFMANSVLTNCTLTNNSADGVWTAQGDVQLINCILWANSGQQIRTDDGTALVSYSDVQGGFLGERNTDADPCFAAPGYWDPNATLNDPADDFWVDGDYRLKSQGGRYDPNTQTWVYDDVTSPCIDAGDPMSPIGYEPFPNGGVINMGAYGDTAEASKSYFGEPVCQTIVAGDINGDCKVDFADFALMALHWLEQR